MGGFTPRSDMRAAFLALVENLASLEALGVTVERWNGDPKAFNEDAAYPVVAVGSPPEGVPRTIFGEPGEADGLGYSRETYFGVYVLTSDANDNDAEAQAEAILDALETGLPGYMFTQDNARRRIDLAHGKEDAEVLIDAAAHRRIYGLTFKTTTLRRGA